MRSPVPRIVVSCPLAGSVLDGLAELEVDVGPPEGRPRAELLSAVVQADGLIAMLTDRVDDELLDAAPKLKVVANHAVGVDNIDLAACRNRGVMVANTPGVLTEATADFAWGLLLSAARRVAEGDRVIRGNRWPGWTPTFMLGRAVSHRRLGIIGCGRIGQAVARRARGFSMEVVYAQPRRLDESVERELALHHVSLDALLETSDFVSVHCPLTPRTHHLLDARRLAAMKPGSVLVNTSRGPVIDEVALAKALADGPLASAGLDVFEREPHVPAALVALDNVVLAPHLGSADEPTRIAMGQLCVDAIVAALRGDVPANAVL